MKWDTKLDQGTEYPHDFVDEVIKLRRRNNVANWIRWYEGDAVRSEIRSQLASTGKNVGEQAIFSYLSAGFFEDACKQAIEVGDVRLATLLAQASSGRRRRRVSTGSARSIKHLEEQWSRCSDLYRISSSSRGCLAVM